MKPPRDRRARTDRAVALLNRSLLTVNPEVYAEFLARLDAPAQVNARLRRSGARPPSSVSEPVVNCY
jgi:uncharacterized protein (DUF1778 family)